ncbi:uncharacterized protein IL334_000695 [Kwoniella shivajii]|uniref:VASt domain-containing protein n=1 Tax=Kwoniella shivajii TaxID=564305 RepID=A0ABZ1CRD9_9TREE|nr:hypothetical protein IL334_000695 [Kwoniella shivajii]
MPSILSRFKRSPSTSSSNGDLAEESRSRRSSVVSSNYTYEEGEQHITSPGRSKIAVPPGPGGSIFVENFSDNNQNQNQNTSSSPVKRQITPSPRDRPAPLNVPVSNSNPPIQPLGTPKLVLTEEGSNSPRSFNSSPVVTSPTKVDRTRPTLGLGISNTDRDTTEDDLETPTAYDHSYKEMSLPVDSTTRVRSGSIISSNGGHSRRGSILSRTTKDATSPPLSPEGLHPVDSRQTSGSKKSRKRRTKSITSTSGQSGIAAALAKGGLHITGPVVSDDFLKSMHIKPRHRSKRSPFLTSRKDGDDDGGHGEEINGEDDFEGDDFDDDDDDSSSDLGDDLPVTGFAVASNKRNADFHALFPSIDDGDYLIEDYGCALSKDILLQGRLYVSENHLCFHANILGWVTDVVVAFADIRTIEKKMTALVIPNAIQVTTGNAKYTFASLIARDSTYDVMMNIWRLCNPNAVMSSVSLAQTNVGSRPGSVAGDDADAPNSGGNKEGGASKGHGPTQCACGKEGKHYGETALDTTFHSTPEKIYELMFNSGWFKTFLSDNQKLRDIESSEWKPMGPSDPLLTRSTSYIKPLNGSIGPKQTKCHIVDEHDHVDYDDYISLITTTKTPDVPSGGVFSVKTRTCLMWAGKNATKVVVTTTVEWTGKSWVKGIIEKSCIEGQKTYHDDLETGMRQYIKENASEFAGEGGEDEDEVAEIESKEAAEKGAGENVSEAQKYANDQAKKQRKEQDLGLLQSGIDSLVAGIKAIFSGIKGIFDSVEDMLEDTPFKLSNLLAILIILLVISNVYTYLKIDKKASSTRRSKKLSPSHKRDEYGNGDISGGIEDIEEAVKRVLRQKASSQTPKEESIELLKILDNVESRVNKLRDDIASIEFDNLITKPSEGSGTLNDLD